MQKIFGNCELNIIIQKNQLKNNGIKYNYTHAKTIVSQMLFLISISYHNSFSISTTYNISTTVLHTTVGPVNVYKISKGQI